MAKIPNDKYYTPIDLANYCWDKVIEVIGEENISEIIEPSCGDGAFYHHKSYIPHFGFDIDPQCNYTNIIKGNYLEQDIPYLWGRLVIGNPPYGEKFRLGTQFFKKSIQIADYIAFIFPIHLLNNTHSLYEFDLIYSEDLGKREFSGKQLHCCFNIYRRLTNGCLNKKNKYKLKDVSIYRQDSKSYENREYDLRICYWGNGTVGKILNEDEHYAAEYKIEIHNEDLKEQIIEVIKNYDWKSNIKGIAMKKIQQFQIYDVLKQYIPNIQ